MNQKVYKNKVITVVTERISKAGKNFDAFKVIEADAVVILPMIGNKVVMERQYRYPIGKYIYELPAGHINKKENTAKAAIRELEEETGYHAGRIIHMFDAYPTPGTNTLKYCFYLASDLTPSKTSMDKDEIISVKLVPFEKTLNMIRQNSIEDCKTAMSLLYYGKFMKQGKE
jgi:ADP-ribose pyrophosphatase